MDNGYSSHSFLIKGPLKYYISALGGVGGLTQIADVAHALKGGWGVWGSNADVISRDFTLVLGLFNCLYLSQFFTDFGQILDSKSYDQA